MTYVTPGGKRVTSESAYLTPEVIARPNLKVITRAHVTRVLFDRPGALATLRAIGAEFTHNNGDTFQVKAKKEVVIWHVIYSLLFCRLPLMQVSIVPEQYILHTYVVLFHTRS